VRATTRDTVLAAATLTTPGSLAHLRAVAFAARSSHHHSAMVALAAMSVRLNPQALAATSLNGAALLAAALLGGGLEVLATACDDSARDIALAVQSSGPDAPPTSADHGNTTASAAAPLVLRLALRLLDPRFWEAAVGPDAAPIALRQCLERAVVGARAGSLPRLHRPAPALVSLSRLTKHAAEAAEAAGPGWAASPGHAGPSLLDAVGTLMLSRSVALGLPLFKDSTDGMAWPPLVELLVTGRVAEALPSLSRVDAASPILAGVLPLLRRLAEAPGTAPDQLAGAATAAAFLADAALGRPDNLRMYPALSRDLCRLAAALDSRATVRPVRSAGEALFVERNPVVLSALIFACLGPEAIEGAPSALCAVLLRLPMRRLLALASQTQLASLLWASIDSAAAAAGPREAGTAVWLRRGLLMQLTVLAVVLPSTLSIVSDADLEAGGRLLPTGALWRDDSEHQDVDIMSSDGGVKDDVIAIAAREGCGLVPLLRDAVLALTFERSADAGAPGPGDEGAAADPALVSLARRAIGDLFSALYVRHLRCPLAPQSAWHAPTLHHAALVRDAIALADADEEDEDADDDDGTIGGALPGPTSSEPSLQWVSGGVTTAAVASVSDAPSSRRAWRLLRRAPYLVAFRERAVVFTHLLGNARARVRGGGRGFVGGGLGGGRFVTVRRSHLLEDGYAALDAPGAALRAQVRVEFVDDHGLLEPGVDGGGLFKDFLEALLHEAAAPEHGLFRETPDRRLTPAPSPASAASAERHLARLRFVGKMLGKASFEGILVEFPLAPFVLKRMRGTAGDVEDLPSLDPELHRHLVSLRALASSSGLVAGVGGVEAPNDPVADLGLFFSAEAEVVPNSPAKDRSISNSSPAFRTVSVALIPGGCDLPVTAANVYDYVRLLSHWKLNVWLRRELDALCGGFHEVIDRRWTSLFAGEELRMVICGADDGVGGGGGGWSVAELRPHVTFPAGSYHDEHPVIQWLWETLEGFSAKDKGLFLRFVTACSRPPLLGFGYLEPPLQIVPGSLGDEGRNDGATRLPTAATCMNLLKLPPFGSAEALREKLLLAVRSGSGFALS